VVALVLIGPKITEVKNPYRKIKKTTDKGPIFDLFSSWQVLNIQCYPDLKSSLDVHDSTKHYVNGPEAFMTTVLGEFRDAYCRFGEITKRISKRVRPPLESCSMLKYGTSFYSKTTITPWLDGTSGHIKPSAS